MFRYFTLILLLAVAERSYSRFSRGRVTLGDSLYDFASTIQYLDDINSGETLVYSIQEDQRESGKILAAIGNTIFSINKYGYFTHLAGSMIAGNANGKATSARFNQTAGFAQLNSSVILISDQNNRCIRKLNRETGQVTTYAGVCGSNVKHYGYYNYRTWETFNSPTALKLDTTNQIHVLDVRDGNPLIASKDLNTGAKTITFSVSPKVNDFIYNSDTSSFTISSSSTSAGIYSMPENGLQTRIGPGGFDGAYGLALSDGILLVTDKDQGVVKAIDTQRNNELLFNLCSKDSLNFDDWNLPYCRLTSPTAVAVIGDYLYFGNTELSSGFRQKVIIKRISISIVGVDEYTETTTRTVPRLTSWFQTDDDFDSSTSSGAGTVAIAIIVGVIAVIAKFACIGWCLYRRIRRRPFRTAATTIVSVSQPTTTVIQQSTVPYGRLQESYSPAMEGNFPSPPKYEHVQHQQQQQQHQQQQQQQPPPRYASSAYPPPSAGGY